METRAFIAVADRRRRLKTRTFRSLARKGEDEERERNLRSLARSCARASVCCNNLARSSSPKDVVIDGRRRNQR